jgi:hypothetical protein
MKYMLHGAYRTQPIMRLTLGCTLVFLGLLWVSNFLLYFQRMSLEPATVVRYYRGSESEFAAPRTYGSMLETSHGHFAMMALVLLLLTHLAIFVPWSLRLRVMLIAVTFAAAFGDEIAGWLVLYVHPDFAWMKIVSFVTLQVGLAILLAGLALHIGRSPENGADSRSQAEH